MTIQCRLAEVGAIKVNVLTDAAVMQIGDSQTVDLIDWAIALQRRYANFQKDETRFASYPIFSLPLPRFPEAPDALIVSSSLTNRICVGTVRVLSIRASSYFQTGCAGRLTAESRIQHIRQYSDT